jgi:hypothetical protein
MASRLWLFAAAASAGLFAGGSSAYAQSAILSGGRSNERSTLPPLTWYAPSLGIATPRGPLVRVPVSDSMAPATLTALTPWSVRADSATVSVDPLLHCPMPIATRDSARVPAMPVFETDHRAPNSGYLRGCVNRISGKR